MSILTAWPPIPPGPFRITIAEHQPRTIRRYIPPGRVIWFTIRPTPFFRVEILHGYKTQASAVITIGF